MAKHIVKCPICKESFDTNVIQAVKYGARRYAHASCDPNNTDFIPLGPEADPELLDLKEYISKLFKEPNWALINKQIKKFVEENHYSYSGIKKSLVYFYNVKGNSIDKANNAIGIVPYCYQDAYNYYYSLFIATQANENKTLVEKVKEYIIKPPKKKGKKNELLEWEEDELE